MAASEAPTAPAVIRNGDRSDRRWQTSVTSPAETVGKAVTFAEPAGAKPDAPSVPAVDRLSRLVKP